MFVCLQIPTLHGVVHRGGKYEPPLGFPSASDQRCRVFPISIDVCRLDVTAGSVVWCRRHGEAFQAVGLRLRENFFDGGARRVGQGDIPSADVKLTGRVETYGAKIGVEQVGVVDFTVFEIFPPE